MNHRIFERTLRPLVFRGACLFERHYNHSSFGLVLGFRGFSALKISGGAIWLSNIITFALWYWNLDRGGPAARAAGRYVRPALIFPEMLHPQHVGENWTPTFVDYFHFAFATATAFSPTDVSAVKPWMKLMMMAEEAISLVVAILVVARAVNILK